MSILPPTSPPRIGGLCFGYGGLDLAVQSVIPDAHLAWYAEFNKGASKIGAHRFPGVPNHGDMTKIDWAAVEPVDILTGGTPCQDLSHAGKRAGMTEGTRSNLWVAMREAIAQIRPSLVVWENVGGAFSAAADSEVEPCAGCVGDGSGVHLRALGRVLGDLSALGYDASWHSLRAAEVGAPHGRLRVFVVAHPRHEARSSELGEQLCRTSGPWESDPFLGPNGAPCLPSLGESCGRCHRCTPPQVLPTPSARDWKDHTIRREPHRPDDMDTLARALTVTLLPTPRAGDGEKGGPNQRGSSGDLMLPSAVTHLLPTPTSQSAKHGDGEKDRGPGTPDDANLWTIVRREARWGQYAAAIHRWESLTRPAPPPTETGPKGNPRLSAAFSEWMMGLPAGWVTAVPGITRNEALKALGNGVVPQQAAAALREMFAWEATA